MSKATVKKFCMFGQPQPAQSLFSPKCRNLRIIQDPVPKSARQIPTVQNYHIFRAASRALWQFKQMLRKDTNVVASIASTSIPDIFTISTRNIVQNKHLEQRITANQTKVYGYIKAEAKPQKVDI